MGKQETKNTPTAKLELDKSMHKRTQEPDNASSETQMFSFNPQPIFFVCDATKLYYRRSENISIDVNAICEHFGDNKLKFEWEYMELESNGSCGRRFTNTTNEPYAVISALNNIANNHNIRIRATVSDVNNPIKKVDANNSITVKPVITPKEISDKIEWFCILNEKQAKRSERTRNGDIEAKANSEFDKLIYSTIDIYGYNGEEVTVNRVIILKGKVIFDNTERLIVFDNSLLVKFNRSEIINQTKDGDTVTLKYVVTTKAREGNYKAVQRNFKIIKHTLVEGEVVDVLQPVVCGPMKIQENTFKQCKYRKIEAEYTQDEKKGKITLFQENDNIEPLPINLIGGKRKVDIILSEYTPEKCRVKEGSHKSNNKAILTGYKICPEGEPIDIKNSRITREFEYDYPSKSAANLVFDQKIFSSYLWCGKNNRRQYTLLLATCRHTKMVEINMYPDIEWEFALAVSLDSPSAYAYNNKKNDTNKPSASKSNERYKEAHRKAIESAWAREAAKRGEGVDYEFELSLKSTIHRGGIKQVDEHAASMVANIQTFIEVVSKIKQLAEKVKGKSGGAVKKIPIVGSSPFSIEILSPKIGAMISWKLENDKSTNIVGCVGTLSVFADPLMGAEFTIDLIAVGASAINPVIGKIISWCRGGLSALGGQFVIELKFYGKLDISLDGVKFNTATKQISAGGEQTISGKMGLMLHLEATIGATAKIVSAKPSFKFTAEAVAQAYFGGDFTLNASSDAGVYLDITGKFSGLLLSATFEIKAQWWIFSYSKKLELEAEPLFEPDKGFRIGQAKLI